LDRVKLLKLHQHQETFNVVLHMKEAATMDQVVEFSRKSSANQAKNLFITAG